MNRVVKLIAASGLFMASLTCGAQSATIDLDIPVTFNMLLDARPDLADEYVRLERDIGQLENLLYNAERLHNEAVKEYATYRTRSENPYNQHESFRLFRQLDQKQVQQTMRDTVYDLNRLQLKQDTVMSQLAALKKQVRQAYIEKNRMPAEQWQKRLLSGEPVVLFPSQHVDLFTFLSGLGKQPVNLARALGNASVEAILPDHIKEQLQLFRESGVSVKQALSNKRVMEVVIANLQPDNVIVPVEDEVTVLSAYRVETAFQDVDTINAAPLQLGSYLDAQMVEMNDLVELYDLPVPSRAVVDSL